MRELVLPDPRWQRSWLESAAEFDRNPPGTQHGSGLWEGRADLELEDAREFAGWCRALLTKEDPATVLEPDRVHATYRWLLVDDEYAGCITVRHALTPYLLEEGGHIGYSVRPSARRRGHATWMLARILELAAGLGLDRVLLTCDTTNAASRATILANGGAFEDVRAGRERYWIGIHRCGPDGPGRVGGAGTTGEH